ncbi:hypothetical protein MCEMSE6_00439 [Oxalobacteraceae bacterium]
MNVDPMLEFQSNQASPSEGKAKISGYRNFAGFSLFFQHLTQRSSQLGSAWSLAHIKRLLLILFPIVFISFILFSWLNARYTSMAVSRTAARTCCFKSHCQINLSGYRSRACATLSDGG